MHPLPRTLLQLHFFFFTSLPVLLLLCWINMAWFKSSILNRNFHPARSLPCCNKPLEYCLSSLPGRCDLWCLKCSNSFGPWKRAAVVPRLPLAHGSPRVLIRASKMPSIAEPFVDLRFGNTLKLRGSPNLTGLTKFEDIHCVIASKTQKRLYKPVQGIGKRNAKWEDSSDCICKARCLKSNIDSTSGSIKSLVVGWAQFCSVPWSMNTMRSALTLDCLQQCRIVCFASHVATECFMMWKTTKS